MSSPIRVGIVGCGSISGIYAENLQKYAMVELAAVADLVPERAAEVGARTGVRDLSVAEMMASPDIDLILNLTVPKAHFDVANRALNAGKHVYSEKPLAVNRDEGSQLVHLAESKGVRIGGAPDTFLGAALQTCRELIDSGEIGEIVGANAFMLCPGHESWHPSPEFYYEVGGGPLLDMGPYYITALVSLLGAVKRVSAFASVPQSERTITSTPKSGTKIQVETPTHIVSALELESGAIAHLTTSFDVWASRFANIEIYGTRGSLAVPDPNGFGGSIHLWRAGAREWTEVPCSRPYSQNSRGLGVMDMAYAIRNQRPHRASGSLTMHVLDVMLSVLDAAAEGAVVTVGSRTDRPAPLSASLPENGLDS